MELIILWSTWPIFLIIGRYLNRAWLKSFSIDMNIRNGGFEGLHIFYLLPFANIITCGALLLWIIWNKRTNIIYWISNKDVHDEMKRKREWYNYKSNLKS